MTDDIRANIGMAFFAVFVFGTMAVVILWDMNMCHKPTKETREEQVTKEVLRAVMKPIVKSEPVANCLPFEPEPEGDGKLQSKEDDGITPEIPCEPPLIEDLDLSGVYFDWTPEETHTH